MTSSPPHASDPTSSVEQPWPKRPSISLYVDHGNLLVMEKNLQRSVSPARLMQLAQARGDVKCAVLFTDTRPEAARHLRAWEHAGFLIINCRRYGRQDHERTSAQQSLSKESIDVKLIATANQLLPQMRHDELILVAGDSDYVPLVQRVMCDYRMGVRVFLTHACGLMEPQLAEIHLTELYQFIDQENEGERTQTSLFQRFYRDLDRRFLTDRDAQELNRLSEMLVRCPRCAEDVEIGLWKTHPCHPNYVPLMPAVVSETSLSAALDEVPVTVSAGAAPPVAGPETSTTPSPEVSLTPEPPPIDRLDRERWIDFRLAAQQVPRTGTDEIKEALKRANSETALCWIVDFNRVNRTNDEKFALRRLIEKEPDCPAAVWQQVLTHIQDDITEEIAAHRAQELLESWAGEVLFHDTLALLIHEGVLVLRDHHRVARGSLIHPAFGAFAGLVATTTSPG